MKIFRSRAFLDMAFYIGVAAVCTVLAQTHGAKPQKMTPQKLTIAKDLDRRLARWRSVKMPLDKSALTAQELRMIDKLVEASAMFTPADIEFAARKGAQSAFEREIEFRRGEPAHTDDYLSAITDTRPTLTEAMLAEFDEDIALRTRL
jgi:hypothetical protein